MPDEMAVAESVTSTEVPVALDPAQLNKPEQPAIDAGSSDADLLKTKLGLANQHAKASRKEAEEAKAQLLQLQAEMKQLREAQQSAVRQSLEDQGAWKELYEQERQRSKTLEGRLLNETQELKAELESVTQNAQHERLKASAMSHISRASALNPQQMYVLLQTMLRQDDEGNPVVLSEGVEQPLGDYLVNLKNSNEWAHHFSATTGSRGMGATAAASIAPGMSNPYRTGNLTEALRLEVENPELAKALKAEANG